MQGFGRVAPPRNNNKKHKKRSPRPPSFASVLPACRSSGRSQSGDEGDYRQPLLVAYARAMNSADNIICSASPASGYQSYARMAPHMVEMTSSSGSSSSLCCSGLGENSSAQSHILQQQRQQQQQLHHRNASETHVPISRQQMHEGVTLAHLFAETGDVASLKTVWKETPEKFDMCTRQGWSPVHYAAWNGHLEAIKFLVENTGLQADAQDQWGWSALHCAAQQQHEEICEYMIEKCDCSALEPLNNNGQRPIDLASDPLRQHMLHVSADNRS